ncbi:MAG: cupin domain-containing protein [Actinomycetota bacterium]|nr:cupin domain-containing protein [Actinomycetota bacterium]
MGAHQEVHEVVEGDGWAAADIAVLGEPHGFRKIRKELNVEEMGINAIVVPAGFESGFHFHDEQEEVYFVHRGTIEMDLGDGSTLRLAEGGVVRVDAATHRRVRNVGDGDAVYVVVGAKGGYVGRDGRLPEGEERITRPGDSE